VGRLGRGVAGADGQKRFNRNGAGGVGLMEPQVRTLAGRYQLSSLLATGGMGQVWRARDTLLQRDVAVKVLRSEFTGNPTFLARFRAEAQHTAGLSHPNIAALFDYGEALPDQDGSGEHLAYLVMELVDGEPLSMVLAREQRLDPARTLDVVRQTAAGLAAAHAAGIVHRDVKPGNVLIGSDGTVKITDFGIASSTSSAPLTQTGQVIGTAHYLSPEQAQGAKATPASDVYALGLIAYECLAGRRAFDGENSVQIAVKQIREYPAPLPADVAEDLRRLVDRALDKDPAQRFADGAAFRDAVETVTAGRALPPLLQSARTAVLPSAGHPMATAPTRAMPAPIQGSRRPGPRVLVPLVALLALALVAVAVLVSFDGSPRPAEGDTTAPSTAPVIEVTASDYLGRPIAEVEAELTELGLQVQLRPLQTADVPTGQVIALDPVGELAPGQPVTVTHAVAPPPPPPAEDHEEEDREKEEREEQKERQKEEREEEERD
jgi:hypothetical protein